jgi:hypothetical protein
MALKKEEPWADVVRLNNPEHRARLARVEDAMATRLAGARVPRSAVLAAVVEMGLEVVERELGIPKAKR